MYTLKEINKVKNYEQGVRKSIIQSIGGENDVVDIETKAEEEEIDYADIIEDQQFRWGERQ